MKLPEWITATNLKQVGLLLVVGALPWLVGAAVVACLSTGRSAPMPTPTGIALILAACAVLVVVFLYELAFAYVTEKGVGLTNDPTLDKFDASRLMRGWPEDRHTRRACRDLERTLSATQAADGTAPAGKQQERDDAINAFADVVRAAAALAAGAQTADARREGLGKVTGWMSANSDTYFSRLTYLLDRFQGRINDEYSDVASRTGWLLTSQAFLLAALVGTLNAERISDIPKYWIAQSVSFAGAVFAFVLALGLFHGHALIAQLKKHRDDLEKRANRHFGMPRAGVSKNAFAHVFGHSATKFLPAFTYLAWVVLALAIAGRFYEFSDAKTRVILWPTGEAIPLATGGMSAVPPSPPFAIGAWEFGSQARVDCPDAATTERNADEWISRVVRQWTLRRGPSADDTMVLVGGADRLQLAGHMSRQFDANVGLARKRAEHVRDRLVAATKALKSDDGGVHRLTEKRIFILVAGPQAASKPTDSAAQAADCKNAELSRDRVVHVWMPGLN